VLRVNASGSRSWLAVVLALATIDSVRVAVWRLEPPSPIQTNCARQRTYYVLNPCMAACGSPVLSAARSSCTCLIARHLDSSCGHQNLVHTRQRGCCTSIVPVLCPRPPGSLRAHHCGSAGGSRWSGLAVSGGIPRAALLASTTRSACARLLPLSRHPYGAQARCRR